MTLFVVVPNAIAWLIARPFGPEFALMYSLSLPGCCTLVLADLLFNSIVVAISGFFLSILVDGWIAYLISGPRDLALRLGLLVTYVVISRFLGVCLVLAIASAAD